MVCPFARPKELKTISIDKKKYKKFRSLSKPERKIHTHMFGMSRKDTSHILSEQVFRILCLQSFVNIYTLFFLFYLVKGID